VENFGAQVSNFHRIVLGSCEHAPTKRTTNGRCDAASVAEASEELS
jgi:hypothetical protein